MNKDELVIAEPSNNISRRKASFVLLTTKSANRKGMKKAPPP